MHHKLIKKLSLGLTNEIYTTANNQIIRISRFTKEPFLDRKNEENVINTIMNSDFNDTLFIKKWGYQEDKFFVITDYDPAIVTLSTTGISKTNVIRTSHILHKFHKITPQPEWTIKTFKALDFYHTIKHQIKNSPFQFHNAEEILQNIKNLPPRPQVLCHNDLSINNIIFQDNRLLLIDFEYAALNDPLYDVAAFISETLQSKSNIKTWIQAWQLSKNEIQITYNWMRFQNLLNTHWALLMLQLTNAQVFEHIAKIQYERYQNPVPLVEWWQELQPLI